MKRALASFALAVALAGAQSGLSLHLGGLPLALPLVLAVWAAVEAGLLEGLGVAVAVGYVLDLFAGGPRGLLVSLTVAAYLACRLARTSLSVHGALGFAALTGGATTLVGLGALLLARFTAAPGTAPAASLIGRVLLESLATAAAGLLLHPLLRRLERLLERQPEPGLLGR